MAGAEFDGDGAFLNADQCRIEHDLELQRLNCHSHGADFGAIQLFSAHIGGQLDLANAILTNNTGPALAADGLAVNGGVYLGGLQATGSGTPGAVRLVGARIDGRFALTSHALVINDTGPALYADGLAVSDGAYLGGLQATGSGTLGAVRITRAHISGYFDLNDARLTNNTGPTLSADRLTVDGNITLENSEATGGGTLGAIRLPSAQISGDLDLTGATLTNNTGPALSADGLAVDSNAHLRCLKATGSGNDDDGGAIRFLGAHIIGQLDLTGATLTNNTGPALRSDGLAVDGSTFLTNLQAAASGDLGAVRLVRAQIGGDLDLTGAILTNSTGPGLSADGLALNGNAVLKGLMATGSGGSGTVRLLGAHISSQLDLTGATLTNNTGPALGADGLAVDSNAYLGGLQATGSGDLGAVRLLSAQIRGDLDLTGAILTNNTGLALAANGLVVNGNAGLQLTLAITSDQGDRCGKVELRRVRIAGQLIYELTVITGAGTPDAPNSLALELDGLTYSGVPRVARRTQQDSASELERWLGLLRISTPAYAAQPYRQLAAAAAAEGHDAQVRQVLIAQRRDQLQRATPRRRDRVWGWITRITLGYGYRAWLALLWLLGIVAVSAGLTAGFGTHGLYPKDHEYDGQRCPVVERVVLGIDNALPLVSTTASTTCLVRPASNASAQVVTWTGIGAQVGGWAFATLFVAGFTGAVRKT